MRALVFALLVLLKTSLGSSTLADLPQPSSLNPQPKSYPHLGASALLDGPSGQIYWVHGRSNQINNYLTSLPAHFKATILTYAILFLLFGDATKMLLFSLLSTLLSILKSALNLVLNIPSITV